MFQIGRIGSAIHFAGDAVAAQAEVLPSMSEIDGAVELA
jgi:hypothetical protein